MNRCPVDCVWGQWNGWGPCDKDCGEGTQERVRSFEVEMANGGVECEGDDTESRTCEVSFARSNGLHRSSRDRKLSAKLQGILDSYNG